MNLYKLKLLILIKEIHSISSFYNGDMWDLYLNFIPKDVSSMYNEYYDNDFSENKLPKFMWVLYHTFREFHKSNNKSLIYLIMIFYTHQKHSKKQLVDEGM